VKKGNVPFHQIDESRLDLLRLSDWEELKVAVGSSSVALPEIALTERGNYTEEASKVYAAVCDYLEYVRMKIYENQPFRIEAGLTIINKILTVSDLNDLHRLTLTYENDADYRIYHPVNTLIYVLIISRNMGYQHVNLVELGMAALLHDVGMFKIPEPITNKHEKLTGSEFAYIKRHPEMGKDILMSFKENAQRQNFLAAVYQHHERENGQGYTEGLKGDEIHEYAKIIGISDSFEAMTHNRPHKKAIMQSASIRELLKLKQTQFSMQIIKSFLDALSLYPVGSHVRLNNNAIGMVQAVNKGNPLKPLIKLLFDCHGKRVFEDKQINLAENTILSIVDGAPEEEKITH
jgi:HD-GYP domain-containing protein (c-di-GMP phosphodiesterase class II)